MLRTARPTAADPGRALLDCERARIPRFDRVRAFAADVENAAGPGEFAARYAAFSHWMPNTAPAT